MKNIKIILSISIISIQSTILALASGGDLECHVISSSPTMLRLTAPLDILSVDLSEPVDASNRQVSPHNAWYYVDKRFFPEELGSHQLLPALEQNGFIDINRAICDVNALSESLHRRVDLLFRRLAQYYYRTSSYIGNRDHDRYAAAGWFGGISMNALLMLNEFAKEMDGLSESQKTEVMGIGSGGAFLESLLDAVGMQVSAMDVQDARVTSDFMQTIFCMVAKQDPGLNQEQTIKVRDFADLERRKLENKFFMPIKLYTQKIEGHFSAIIEDTFCKEDYSKVVLLLSWPREFANDYIRAFIKKGGNAVLFVRNSKVDSVFSDVYLGESKVSAFLNRAFRRVSFDLNTVTGSVIDLYSRGEINPIERALKRAIDRASM